MKLADKISIDLQAWVRTTGYDVVIPNFYIGIYEMDVFRLTPSEMIYEYEIKISRSDFFNDFKKQWAGKTKHSLMETGKSACNKFFFVVPEGLVSKAEVPKYAGLIYYTNSRMFRIEKTAPVLHKDKSKTDKDLYRWLCNKLAFRETQHKIKRNIWKRRYDDLIVKVYSSNDNK